MALIYLGLGSNLGARENNIRSAIQKLGEKKIHILQCSSIIETDPVGGPPQGKFLNAVLEATTDLSPFELLKTLKAIETSLGRRKTETNGPRTIDIDILLFDQESITTPELIIPHPRMLSRKFVMNPLREIAPKLVKE